MALPTLAIVTPALADANNGNWQTARRWARMLASRWRVRLVDRWRREPADAMLVLHARRSAASADDWRSARADAPLALALTGTDLYRDIDHDAAAQRTLHAADVLLVLNACAPARLPEALRPRCRLVLPSCGARRPLDKPRDRLRVVMAGHLRDEKDPSTFLRAAARLAHRADIRLDHIGGALDPVLGDAARACAAAHPTYRWLGALPHEATRRRIQAAHLLVHPSRMEGGAHVVIEALRSGTGVVASRIDGNVGLLGDDHPALFDVGDDAALAALVLRARDEPDMLAALVRAGDRRAALYTPQAEADALQRALADLVPDAGDSR